MKTRLLTLLIVLAAFSSTIQAAGKPQIAAPEVTSTTTNSATLLIGINANVAQTTVTIQYNTSGNFFDPLTTVNVGVTSGIVNYAPTISGLGSNTTYHFRVRASNFYGDTYSTASSFITKSGLPPTISAITVSPLSDTKATVNFNIDANNNGTVKYDVLVSTSSNFTGVDIGANVPTTAGGVVSKSILGLTPSTQYYYKIIAKSGVEDAQRSDSYVQNFTTPAFVAPTLLYDFKFDNSYSNEPSGTDNVSAVYSFESNAGTSFTTDRHENATGAIRIQNTGVAGILNGLPYGKASRTVSLWAKMNTLRVDYNMLFTYGAQSNKNAFGAGLGSGVMYAFGYNNNFSKATTYTVDEWYHFAITFDGDSAKLFKNGVFVGGEPRPEWNTLSNNNTFKLGTGPGGELFFDGAFDDLKIYDKELTNAQVLSLYQSNVIASNKSINAPSLNYKVYPNPATEIIGFESAAENATKEIYTLQGNKVLLTNENTVSIAHLPAGIYLVKITTADNKTAMSRFMKK